MTHNRNMRSAIKLPQGPWQGLFGLVTSARKLQVDHQDKHLVIVFWPRFKALTLEFFASLAQGPSAWIVFSLRQLLALRPQHLKRKIYKCCIFQLNRSSRITKRTRRTGRTASDTTWVWTSASRSSPGKAVVKGKVNTLTQHQRHGRRWIQMSSWLLLCCRLGSKMQKCTSICYTHTHTHTRTHIHAQPLCHEMRNSKDLFFHFHSRALNVTCTAILGS